MKNEKQHQIDSMNTCWQKGVNTDKVKVYLSKLELYYTEGNTESFIDYRILKRNLRLLLKQGTSSFMIEELIKSLKKRNSWNINDVEEIYSIILDQSKNRHWKIYFPINVYVEKEEFTFLDSKFHFFLTKDLSNKYSETQFELLQTKKKFSAKQQWTIMIESYGNIFFDAYTNNEDKIECLKGIIDFSLSFGQWKFFIDNCNMAQIDTPESVYGISDDVYKYLNHTYPTSKNQNFQLEGQADKNFNFISSKFQTKPKEGSILALLANCFKLYANAVETNNIQYRFLTFWQIAEELALSNNFKGSTMKVLSRIMHLIEKKNSQGVTSMIPILESLPNKRNDLVHRGHQDFDDLEINCLKQVVEWCIIWLLHRLEDISTIQHLEIYYNYKDKGNVEIQNIKDIMEFLSKK